MDIIIHALRKKENALGNRMKWAEIPARFIIGPMVYFSGRLF